MYIERKRKITKINEVRDEEETLPKRGTTRKKTCLK